LTVWDCENGQKCLSRAGADLTFAFHPREDAIVIEESPYTTVRYALPSGEEQVRWTAPEPRLYGGRAGWHTLAFSPNGRLLAGVAVGTLLLEFMDPNTGEQLRLITNSARPDAISWNGTGSSLAVATADNRVSIWNPTTGALRWSAPPMIAAAHTLAFHPHRDWLAAGCLDGKVRFIDTYQQRFVFEYPAESRRIAFSPHGTRLGPVWSEGQVGWLQINRPDAFVSFGAGGSRLRLTDGAFSKDGKTLMVGSVESVVICNAHLGRTARTMSQWRMSACAFHPRDDYLIAADNKGISRYAHELAGTGATLSALETIHSGPRWLAFAFNTDGRYFAAFNAESRSVFVFDHTLTNQLASFGNQTNVEALALSPDGRWLTTGSSKDRMVHFWDVQAREPIFSLPTGDQPRSAFSADGRWFAVTAGGFKLLHSGTWQPAPPLKFSEARPIPGAAAFSPDSRMLALVVNRFEVHLFDLRTFERLAVLRPPGAIQILSLIFSPDGSQLAGVGVEARVAVWNLRAAEKGLQEFGLGWDLAEAGSRP
jgi:WD40 repeat protein